MQHALLLRAWRVFLIISILTRRFYRFQFQIKQLKCTSMDSYMNITKSVKKKTKLSIFCWWIILSCRKCRADDFYEIFRHVSIHWKCMENSLKFENKIRTASRNKIRYSSSLAYLIINKIEWKLFTQLFANSIHNEWS